MPSRFRRSSSAPARMQPHRKSRTKSRATKTTRKDGLNFWHVEPPGRSFLMKYPTAAGQRKAKFKAAMRTTKSNQSNDENQSNGDSEAVWANAVANAMRARAPVSEMLDTPPSARGYVTQPTPSPGAAMDNLTLAPVVPKTPPPTPLGPHIMTTPFAAAAARVWSAIAYDTPTKPEFDLAKNDAAAVDRVVNCVHMT